jgi:hypothetical protein
VYTFWSKLAGDRFRENPLRRLGRRKTRKVGFAAECRGVAGGNNGAFSCRDHSRRQPSGQIEQRHRIDLKVSVQHLGIDFQKVPERTTHRIMDQHFRCTELGAYRRKGGVELRFIGDIAWIGTRARDLSLQHDEPLLITSEHRNRIAAARKAAHDRRARSWTYPGHHRNRARLIHCNFLSLEVV